MKVSVVIPNYNHSAYLKDRIESVLNQTYQDYEVVILDDCSTDASKEIIELYRNHPRVSKIEYNKENSGSTFKQWNKGVGLAKGEWVWLAESDDVAEPDYLDTLMTKVEDTPGLGIAYCQSNRMNNKGEVTGNWLDWTKDLDKGLFLQEFQLNGLEYIERFLVYRNTIPNASAVVFKKSCFFAVGGADEEIRYCADWLLWLKILLRYNVAYVPLALNNFRYHERSVIAQAIQQRGEDQFHEKYDRSMRMKLNEHLLAAITKRSSIKKAVAANRRYIGLDDCREGVHYLRINRNRGWALIIRGSIRMKSVIYLRSALKQTLIKKLSLKQF